MGFIEDGRELIRNAWEEKHYTRHQQEKKILTDFNNSKSWWMTGQTASRVMEDFKQKLDCVQLGGWWLGGWARWSLRSLPSLIVYCFMIAHPRTLQSLWFFYSTPWVAFKRERFLPRTYSGWGSVGWCFKGLARGEINTTRRMPFPCFQHLG